MQSAEKARPLPKFGEWDVNNPASADGFTVIFAKARDEKKGTGNSAARQPPAARPGDPRDDDLPTHHLRANASSSARLSSDSGGEPIFEFFRLSGSPPNRTNLPRYFSSDSERLPALICSFMVNSGLKNQSYRESLGLFVLVISVLSSAHGMEVEAIPAELALAERRSTWRKQYAGRPILMVLPLSRLDLASSKSFRVITPSDARISPLHRHASKKASAIYKIVEAFMEFERLGGFPRESDFEKEPARELVLEEVSVLRKYNLEFKNLLVWSKYVKIPWCLVKKFRKESSRNK
nr:RPM1-interacting protein 4-like [Ipomoea batatas]